MENNMKELDLDTLESVKGGVMRQVNTGTPGLDAALRASATKSSKQIGHLPNGTMVDTVSDQLVYDPESGRNFVQVTVNGKVGWIAASIIGMKR